MDHGSMALCSLTGQLGWADSNLAARNWTRWTKKNVIWKARLLATKPPHNKVELEEKILGTFFIWLHPQALYTTWQQASWLDWQRLGNRQLGISGPYWRLLLERLVLETSATPQLTFDIVIPVQETSPS